MHISTRSLTPHLARLGLLRSKPKRSHALRYVLRNRSTDEVYLVVIFTLYRKEVVNEDGTLKPEASENQATISEGDLAAAAGKGKEDGDFDEEAALKEAKRRLSEVDLEETRNDDVD